MTRYLILTAVLFCFGVPAYADQPSNEPADAANEAETNDAEEDSKGNDFFCDYSKAC